MTECNKDCTNCKYLSGRTDNKDYPYGYENHDDYYCVVKQGNKIISKFYFSYQGEIAVVITRR